MRFERFCRGRSLVSPQNPLRTRGQTEIGADYWSGARFREATIPATVRSFCD